MVEERDNYVYIVEADPQAVARAVHRLQILVLTFIPILLIGVGLAMFLRSLTGDSPSLSSSLPALLILLAIPPVAAYLIVPRCVKRTDVTVGADFILAPTMTFPQSRVIVRYKDIGRIRLDVLDGHLVGAAIGTKGLRVYTGRVKDPAVVIRAIFERAPDTVKWRRSRHPFRRMSLEDVRALIEKSQAPPLSRLLPPSVTLARADDVFPPKKGLFGRRSDREAPATFKGLSSERPTPASRYVNFMLLQMFRDGETTRILKRSEQLPTLTLESGTAEPPPLQDILSRLKTMCRLDPKSDPGPMDGTIDVTINGTACHAVCRFDDKDVCCEIRLERIAP